MSEQGVIDAQVIDEPGSELAAPSQQATSTLFRTDDPALVLTRATEIANALKPVLDSQGLTVAIQGRKHVIVEGWQTLGAMLGVTPVCEWTRPISEPAKGWEARVVARTLDGRIIGSAEAMCERSESTWKNLDDYALRSMAQTRATSKALASPLRFIVTLAGYSGTPAEEMPANGEPAEAPVQTFADPPSDAPRIDIERVEKIGAAIGALQLGYRRIGQLLSSCRINGLRAQSGKALRERIESLTEEQANHLEAALELAALDQTDQAGASDA